MTVAEYLLENPNPRRQWHPTRNRLNPETVTAGSKKRAWFRCGEGHEWEAAVYSVILEGCGCPYCAGRSAIPGVNDLATVHPDLLVQWDYEKNVDLDPGTILPSVHRKVWWKCSLGHSWEARVFSRTKEKGSRCPYCTGKLVLAGFNDLATVNPKIAGEWYPLLNGELMPEDVTVQSNQKVWWQCRSGHVWRAAVYSRTRKRGSGCPVCAGTVRQRRTVTLQPRKRAQVCGTDEQASAVMNV